MFQLNKQNTVKMGGGGGGDKGLHKKTHNKQLEWNKLDVQQYNVYQCICTINNTKMYTDAYHVLKRESKTKTKKQQPITTRERTQNYCLLWNCNQCIKMLAMSWNKPCTWQWHVHVCHVPALYRHYNPSQCLHVYCMHSFCIKKVVCKWAVSVVSHLHLSAMRLQLLC